MRWTTPLPSTAACGWIPPSGVWRSLTGSALALPTSRRSREENRHWLAIKDGAFMLHMPLPLAAQWSKRILAGEGDAKSQNPVLRQNACSDWFGMLRIVWVYLGLGFAWLPRRADTSTPVGIPFFLSLSWPLLTSLGLTLPRFFLMGD